MEKPTECSRRITIQDNWIVISKRDCGGQGWFMQSQSGPIDVVIDHNTIEMDGNQFIQGNAPDHSTPGFKFTGNIVKNIGAYGTSLHVGTTDEKHGNKWREYFNDGVFSGNAFAGDNGTFKNNMPDNLHKSVADSAALVVDGYGVGAFEGYGRRAGPASKGY
jgi:hypothetical protein